MLHLYLLKYFTITTPHIDVASTYAILRYVVITLYSHQNLFIIINITCQIFQPLSTHRHGSWRSMPQLCQVDCTEESSPRRGKSRSHCPYSRWSDLSCCLGNRSTGQHGKRVWRTEHGTTGVCRTEHKISGVCRIKHKIAGVCRIEHEIAGVCRIKHKIAGVCRIKQECARQSTK